jgi:hypothetical protein
MEKIIQLDPRELQQVQGIEQQRIQALAQIGLCTTADKQNKANMAAAERSLEASEETHRNFMRQALVARGIERYESARAVPGGIAVSVGAPPAEITAQPAAVRSHKKANSGPSPDPTQELLKVE